MSRLPLGEGSAAGVARLEEIARQTLGEARAEGASQAEVALSTSEGLAVDVRLGEVETVEHTRHKALGLSVYFGHRKGTASTTDFSDAAITETVRAACRIARHTAEDPCAGLADAELMATEVPDLDLHHPWRLTAEQAIDIALEAETAARGADPKIVNSEGAGVNRLESVQVYANSHGFVGGFPSSRHALSCSVIAGDEGRMQRGYWYDVARDAAALEPAADIGREAARRSLRRLGARRLGTRSVPVLFAAEVAVGLFAHFVSAVSGGNLYRKASFLVDHLGKTVFPAHVRVHEQPHLRGALGSAPFDREGVATRERDLVTDGVLRGYVLGSYSARRLGMRTTGNAGGVHNLVAEPTDGGLDRDGMLRTLGTGLLVTEMMGMGVNTVTGDYSRGAAGFWVENGEMAYPVEEITIAGNLREMFLGVRAIGADVERRGNIRCGSVLIDRMTVAGT